ncbi:DUF6644 family protein [Phenylobacterium sp. J367]|uniref:DUF6644 family protein n=1 Tax=Phenylobacterium sp. J367 TaxID=2898435 RepID=UPI0021517081|nr:DUF6644 family protein [Phenylobacterium sp. J367]MCR5877911.1 hypothetical protein [Phenylobacterium sp. J367]
MKPSDIFPTIRPWVEGLVDVWPAYIIKPQFASWQVLHILSLVVLGGVSILINLRLIGVGVTNESPSEVQRNLRPWMHVGVIGIIVSGVLIGMANAERLYDSVAFTVKMLALVAGVILTYGASLPTARADGRVSAGVRVWFLVGLAVFGLALFVFAGGELVNPGVWHMILAAALIVLIAAQGAAPVDLSGGPAGAGRGPVRGHPFHRQAGRLRAARPGKHRLCLGVPGVDLRPGGLAAVHRARSGERQAGQGHRLRHHPRLGRGRRRRAMDRLRLTHEEGPRGVGPSTTPGRGVRSVGRPGRGR